eukprot:scaffold14129_cov133-Isochrysis_galbana.AAC.4
MGKCIHHKAGATCKKEHKDTKGTPKPSFAPSLKKKNFAAMAKTASTFTTPVAPAPAPPPQANTMRAPSTLNLMTSSSRFTIQP